MATDRVQLRARVSAGGVAWLDRVAEAEGVNRTDALRAALKVATVHEREVLAAAKLAKESR